MMSNSDFEDLMRSKGGCLIKQGAEAKIYKLTLISSKSFSSTNQNNQSSIIQAQPRTIKSTNISLNSTDLNKTFFSSESYYKNSCLSSKFIKDQVIIKHRFPKTYRNPKLDSQLTKQRLTQESRSLVRAIKSGIRVPNLISVNLKQGWIMMEFINGINLKEFLQNNSSKSIEISNQEFESSSNIESFEKDVLREVGKILSNIHLIDMIHGDLTTSNIMISSKRTNRSNEKIDDKSDEESFKELSIDNFEIVLIDFGLSSSIVNSIVEDKAVDLYVLERAFTSTHSTTKDFKLDFSMMFDVGCSSMLFDEVLESYSKNLTSKDWKLIFDRLKNVRLRGRKRSMVG
ncbi:BUD32 protein kinase [Phakopsora pachyrhizi]|uniref:non-specific serine/threonine protein kinase n=1 Tax=Phakopsora pachyrhizi TaxID=170000 RepID=A0AAV0B8B9_PHAPC|nr:BUD32 protein kinase [Phakopsora pachyrhizi]CAH7680948.1 BUD32 protein kinase [Phakopsora pachyrhizi]